MAANYLWDLKSGLVTKNKLKEYECPMTGHSNVMERLELFMVGQTCMVELKTFVTKRKVLSYEIYL